MVYSSAYHEAQAKDADGLRRRNAKYGGQREEGEVVDLAEPHIPGVLKKTITRPGNGELVTVGQNAMVHYTGRLKETGEMFDTSTGRGPLVFRLGHGEVIRGWDYAVSTMQKGERCVLEVGPEYGYGERGAGPIPANAALVFDMELIGWEAPPAVQPWQWAALLAIVGIIYYVLFVDDEHDMIMKGKLS